MLKHCSIILIVHIIISIPNFIVFSCVEEPHYEFQRGYSLPRSGHVHESRGIFPRVLRVGKRSKNRFVLRCLSGRSSICVVIRAHGNMSYAHSVKRFFAKASYGQQKNSARNPLQKHASWKARCTSASVGSVNSFEQPNRLDTVLYENIPIQFSLI